MKLINYILIIFIGLGVCNAFGQVEVSATRCINVVGAVRPGAYFDVTLNINVSGPHPPEIIVKEIIPAGWEVTSEDKGFHFNEDAQEAKWVLIGEEVSNRTLTYEVQIPLSAKIGKTEIKGQVLYGQGGDTTKEIAGWSLVTISCFPVDLNGDGKVDTGDLLTVTGSGYWASKVSCSPFDLYGDGIINMLDLGAITASVYWGQKCPCFIIPQISISPQQGSAGTKITVDGNDFAPEERVNIHFGATENIATGDADSDGNLQIQFEADQQTPGMLDVVARGVLFDCDAKDTFEYIVLEIVDISPTNAPIKGGVEVTIAGKDFASGATVAIGGKEATDIHVNQQGTEIVAKTPVISIRELLDLNEPRDVTVTNPDGQSDTKEKVFQYYVPYQLSFARGWNLISFPGDVIEPTPDGFFGTDDITNIQDASGEKPDTFKLGKGYWVSAMKGTSREVKLIPKEKYVLNITRGWNLIGSAYGDASTPTGVILLYSWNAQQKQYDATTLLEPSKGYWTLVIKDTEITVKTEAPPPPTAPTMPSDVLPYFQLPILVSDGHNTIIRLTIGIHPDAQSGFDSRFDVALPPPSPVGEFPHATLLLDVDFPLRLSKKVLPIPKSGAAEFLLQVENPAGDAVLSWDAKQMPDEWSITLINLKSQIDMRKQSTYLLPKEKQEIVLSVKRTLKRALPDSTALFPNYPNPFNPETWIPYQLADSAQVLLIIYDVRGRIVRQFNIGQKAAGIYVSRQDAAYWDGKNDLGERVSSGLYFYQLKIAEAIPSIGAGNFSAYRRMVITK